MHHLFLPAEAFHLDAETERKTAQMTGLDYRHLVTVLRMREGEPLVLLDNRGNAWNARIETVTKGTILATLESEVTLEAEPTIKITVAQALGKGDKFEQVLQHGTEVGATAFVPLRAERSVVEVPAAKVGERVERWRLIAKGAAEQSKRVRIPTVHPPASLAELLKGQTDSSVALLHTGANLMSLKDWLRTHAEISSDNSGEKNLMLCVGPEGGWTEREVSAALASNGTPVSLGSRVLRTETAALVALSQILFFYEKS